MKRLAPLALSMLLVSGCASTNTTAMVSKLASNPLVTSLMSSLGLNASQVVGGAGALLGLAQNKFAAEDWKALASAIPGTDDLVKTANTIGGLTGKAGSLADLSSVFSKLGLTADSVNKMVPALTDYVGKTAGADIGSKLASVLK